jgi:hypothetical protein
MIYSGSLTTSQRQQIEGYLAHKWGLNTALTGGLARPTQIPGCTLWLDAADASTLALSGSAVTSWTDKSSNAFVFSQATSANRPTSGASTINGINVLTYTATQSLLTTSYSQNFTTATVFAVVKATNASYGTWEFMRMLMSPSGTTGLPYFYIEYNNASAYDVVFSITGRNGMGGNLGSSSIAGITQLFTGLITGSTTTNSITRYGTPLSFAFNGTTAGFTSVTNATLEVMGGSAGQAGEFVMFNRILSTSEYQAVEGYLATKWGLRASLPSTHPSYTGIAAQPFALTRPFTRAFQPIDISGCSLWLDAADSSTVSFSSGSNVSQWRDKSGNGYSPSNVSTTVTYNATGLNGLPTITNTNAAASSLTYSGTFINRTNCTLFLVLQRTGSGTQRGGYFCMTPTSGTYDYAGPGGMAWGDGDGGPYQFVAAGAGVDQGTGGNPAFGPSVVVLSLSNTAATMYINGVSALTATLGLNTENAAGFVIANRSFVGVPTGGFPGNISEVLVYNTTLTDTQRQTIEGYLAWKWGLNSQLPGVPLNPLWQSGLALWLDAADSSTVSFSSGSNIASWNDKSGNGRNAIQFNTGFANYDSANKRTVITPTGQLYAPVPAGTFSAGVTGFVVFQKYGANSATADALISRTSGSYPAPFDMYQTGSSTARLVGTGPTTNYRQYTTSFDSFFQSTTMTLYNFSVASSLTWTESRNGNFQTVTGTIANAGTPVYGDTATSIQIGTRDDKYPTANVYIYEIILFNGTFTTSQRQGVESYLANKWGLKVPTSTPHPYFALPASSVALFSPTMISGCALWLDAADPSSMTLSGTNVTQWKDKSSNAYLANGSSGTYPTVSNTMNGLPVLSSPAGKYLTITNFSQSYSTASIFFVFRPTQAINGFTVYPSYYILNPSATNAMQASFGYYSAFGYSVAFNRRGNGITNYTFGSSPSLLNTSTMFTGTITGNASSNILNMNGSGLASTNTAYTFDNLTGVTLYLAGNTSDSYGYDLAELIVFGSVLNTSQIQSVEGYLANKWGLNGSLPSTHPYTKFAPSTPY